MAFNAAQLFALESAMAQGALTVRHADGTSKTYRSLDEMKQLRRQMRVELGQVGADSGRRYAEHSKGL